MTPHTRFGRPAQAGYWRQYHDAEALRRADALRQEHWIESTGIRIHLDLYPQADLAAPTLIFNHGGGGYSRLFIPLALALYERGYTVLLPDQRGQGLSEGDRGDFTVAELVQNIMDAARWMHARVTGPLYLGGGSIGGGLAYYAAAAGAPVSALVLHNLYDFGTGRDGLELSRMAPLAQLPGAKQLFGTSTALLARVLPGLKIPYEWLGRFERMLDERAVGFYARWQKDPYPIKRISLRFLSSMMHTAPAHPLEANTLPALVINQRRDRMVRPAVTRANFDRLGGPKSYAEIDYGHWAMGESFVSEWVGLVDAFLREQM